MSVHACRESSNPRNAGRCACGARIETTNVTSRDPEREREFLRGSERMAGLDIGWAERVEDRLLQMERTKGRDSYRSLGFWRCVAEAEEEGLDLGGWPVLAWLLSYDEFDSDDETGLEARMLLQEIAAYGVRVAGLVERLRELRA